MMRNEDILSLPTRQHLRSFTGKTDKGVGVTALIRHRCAVELSTLPDEDRLVTLIVDEMQLSQAITYDRNSEAVYGLVDLGNLTDLECGEENEPESDETVEPKSAPPEGPGENFANKLLCFVISGLKKRFKFPVGYYFVNSLTGDQLWKLTCHIIEEMESLGFKIFMIVADNASINVALFKKMTGDPRQSVITQHPLDASRILLCCNDYCHILKCVRNLWMKRDFSINGKTVSFELIRKLYEHQKNNLLRPVRFLSRKHVDPSNLERQKVMWAYAIFRPEVTAALKLYQRLGLEDFKHVNKTVTFMETMYKWWCLMDVSNLTQGIHSRDPNHLPYYDPEDERLRWLKEDFLNYIRNWKDDAKEPNQFLSNETYDALVRTTLAVAYGVRNLLENGQKFVLTRRFNSDDVERTFSAIRQVHGSNDRPTAEKAAQSINRILRTGKTCKERKKVNSKNISLFTGIALTTINANVPIEKNGILTSTPLPHKSSLEKKKAEVVLQTSILTEVENHILLDLKYKPGKSKLFNLSSVI